VGWLVVGSLSNNNSGWASCLQCTKQCNIVPAIWCRLVTFCGWEGNRRFGVALAMRHRLSGLSTYRLNDLEFWPMTLKLNWLLAVVKIHVHTKYRQAKCSASWIIMRTSFFPYLTMVKNSKIRSCDLWPWNSLVFVRWSRNVFMQNVVQLSAAVHELSCAQRKKNSDEKITVRSLPRGQSKCLIRYNCLRSIDVKLGQWTLVKLGVCLS